MKFTEEQEEIIAASKQDGNLVINAYAGAGKTSTLVGIVEANPDKSFVYLAFNRSVKNEAEKKFPGNCKVFTLHGLAYRNFAIDYYGAKLQPRLGKRLRNKDFAEMLKVSSKLCFHARETVKKFKNSNNDEIKPFHIPIEYRNTIQNKNANDKHLREVVNLAKKIWEMEYDRDSDFPITHDTYLKAYQLSRPSLTQYDVILVDEAQDTNPVIDAIISRVQAKLIMVGDSFQSIYQWRGAINSIERMSKNNPVKWLTKSFRFGGVIANLSNDIIQMVSELDKTPKLIGNEAVKSHIGLPVELDQRTVLFRTNSALADYALDKISKGFSVYIEGGVRTLCDDLTDLYLLWKGERKTGKSAKYAPYLNFDDVEEEAKDDKELKKDMNFVMKHGHGIPRIVNTLLQSVKDKRSVAKVDFILSTAHKAKGLEWDYVELGNDFFWASTNPVEWNIIYVAVTRAKKGIGGPLNLLQDGMVNYLDNKHITENHFKSEVNKQIKGLKADMDYK